MVDSEGTPVDGFQLVVTYPVERLHALPLRPDEVGDVQIDDWD
jgi:hypothetical protein